MLGFERLLGKSVAADFAPVTVESLGGAPRADDGADDLEAEHEPDPDRRPRRRFARAVVTPDLIKALALLLKARRLSPARGEQQALFGRPAPAAASSPPAPTVAEPPAPAPAPTPTPAGPTEYRYGAYNRPPGFGATPRGLLRVDPPIPGVSETRHGVAVYPHPLTDDEVQSYELSPHVPVHEAVQRMADGLGEYADAYLDDADEDGDDSRLREALHEGLHAGMTRGRRHSDLPANEIATRAIAELRQRRAARPAPPAPPEPVKPPEYRYGAVYRPPGLASVPNGYTRVDPPLPGVEQTRHGVVVYPRPLTDQEVHQFQLSPHVPKAELVGRMLDSVGDKGAAFVALAQRSGDGVIRSRFGKVFERGNLHSDVPDSDVLAEAVAELKRRHGTAEKAPEAPTAAASHQAVVEPHRTSDEVHVKQHLRQTVHGVQVVKEHIAHVKPASLAELAAAHSDALSNHERAKQAVHGGGHRQPMQEAILSEIAGGTVKGKGHIEATLADLHRTADEHRAAYDAVSSPGSPRNFHLDHHGERFRAAREAATAAGLSVAERAKLLSGAYRKWSEARGTQDGDAAVEAAENAVKRLGPKPAKPAKPVKVGDAVPTEGLTPEAYAPHFLHAQQLHRDLMRLVDVEDQRREGLLSQRVDDAARWSHAQQDLEADVQDGKPAAMKRALEFKSTAERALAWAADRARQTGKRYQLEHFRNELDPDRRRTLKIGLPDPRDDAHAFEMDQHLSMGFRHGRDGRAELKGLKGDARAAYRVGRAEAKEHARRDELIAQAERIAVNEFPAHERQWRASLGKAGPPPAPGLELLPAEDNPRVRRWQRVQPHEVHPGATFQVREPEHGDHILHIRHANDHEVGLAWGQERHVWRAPPASVPQLVSDLRGEVHGSPTSGDPTVDAVLDGKGEWLGKGNDGIVHRVGHEVVKSSTVAGYHPENGIRSREESNQITRNEHDAHRAMAHHPLVPAVRLVEHEGRAHLVKPYLHPAGRLSRADVEAAQDFMESAHHHGLVALDQWQFGRDDHGAIKIMDLGSARRSTSHDHREDDQMYMDRLWRENGHEGRNPKGAELERKLSGARLLLNMPLHGAEKTGKATEWLSSSWSKYRRLFDLKSVELLAQDRDDEWNALHDERDAYQRRIDAVHAAAATGVAPMATAAG